MPKMAKEHDPFISLKPQKADMRPPTIKEIESSGPSIYVHGISLPITDKDVGKTLSANVKIKVKSVSKSVSDGGKERKNYDFELSAIRFT